MRWFDPAGWVKLAEEHRVQFSALVPSMIQMLLGQPLEKADLSELTLVSSGASPLAEEVRREFEARVPSAMIYEGYGCTESATLISSNPYGARRVGSVGRPVRRLRGVHPGRRRRDAARGPGRRDLRAVARRDDRLLAQRGHLGAGGRLAAHR